MSNEDDWTWFDNVVNTLLVGAPSISEHVDLLENTIYAQGCLLLGTLPNKKKGLCGLNRRAQHSISLVQERNELLNKLNSSNDRGVKSSLKPLLEHIQIATSTTRWMKQKKTLEIKTGQYSLL